ncbi:MAG: xanthine dehydrogenase family protein molybdopterin-binding subunit, partial [Chloroflexi bacterium]|nr:xanthine dehydrogenase family protein molybdopterin-binding subunit [Chloroflexota bacterium]
MTTADYDRNVVLSSVDYKVIGTRPIRPDGADKVTGRALYGADFDTAGLLHGKVLRSPHAHARIRSIDTSKAEALPGVMAVVSGKDLPQSSDGSPNHARDNILAHDKALYKGHPIAAVAANSPHVAEEALKLIDVDYEVLASVMTAPDAMKEGAPILHEGLTTEELGEKTDKVSNVASHFQHVKGDVEKGFQEADQIVEREYT